MVPSNELPVPTIGVFCPSANISGTRNLEPTALGTDDSDTEVCTAGGFDYLGRAPAVIFFDG